MVAPMGGPTSADSRRASRTVTGRSREDTEMPERTLIRFRCHCGRHVVCEHGSDADRERRCSRCRSDVAFARTSLRQVSLVR